MVEKKKLAERGGFEPPNGNIPLTVFETAAFDRSAISPVFFQKKVKNNIPLKREKASASAIFRGNETAFLCPLGPLCRIHPDAPDLLPGTDYDLILTYGICFASRTFNSFFVATFARN